MNKEIEEIFNTKLYFDLEEEDYIKIKNYIEQLENNRDKAIEYIENGILDNKINEVDWDYDECYFSDMPAERIKPLIDILKGEEKDGIMDKKSK